MEKKGQLAGLGIAITVLVISSAILVMGIIVISEIYDTIDTTSATVNEGVLSDYNKENTLDQIVESSMSATAKNQTFINCTGSPDNITIDDALIENDKNFSFSLWVNPKSTASTQNFLGFADFSSVLDYMNIGTSGTQFRWETRNATNTTSTNFGNVSEFLSAWVNLGLIKNDTGTYIYINGVQNTSLDDYKMGNYALDKFGICHLPRSSATNHYLGLIDEVRVYNRSLLKSELVSIYNSGRNVNNSLSTFGLVAHISMNENTGLTLYDTSKRNTRDFYPYISNKTILTTGQHSSPTSPHTLSIVRPNASGQWNGHTYWGYISPQTAHAIDLRWSEDLETWSEYDGGNPILNTTVDRWASVIFDDTNFYMAVVNKTSPTIHIDLYNGTDGANFSFNETIVWTTSGDQNSNPYLYKDDNSENYYLYYLYQNSTSHDHIKVKKATSPIYLNQSSEKTLLVENDNTTVMAASSVFYYQGLYWLQTETQNGGWQINSYVSDTPDGDFVQVTNNPINASRSEACPFPYINDTTLFNFVCVNIGTWYLDVVKYNLSDYTTISEVTGFKLGNNGTIASATWQDDGVDNTLTQDVDYNYTSDIFQILNSEYAWSNLSLSYQYASLDQAAISTNDTLVGIATFSDFWEVIILALVISIVIGLLIGVFGSGRGR